MSFKLSPSCDQALKTALAVAALVSALSVALVWGVDARVSQIVTPIVAPVREEVAILKVQVTDTREDVREMRAALQRWFEAQRGR